MSAVVSANLPVAAVTSTLPPRVSTTLKGTFSSFLAFLKPRSPGSLTLTSRGALHQEGDAVLGLVGHEVPVELSVVEIDRLVPALSAVHIEV